MDIKDIRSPNLASTTHVSKPAVQSKNGVVVAQNRQAAAIGAAILQQGGNAVDAAIATSFALGVLEPWMSGIGGVGAMLVKPENGPVTAIDAGAVSPAKLDPADFPLVKGQDNDLFGWPSVLEQRNVIGGKSICVPGLVKGLAHAHARFGRRPWEDLVMPAVELAVQGAVVDYHTAAWIAQDMARLEKNEACRQWFLPGGYPPCTPAAVSGHAMHLYNERLAETLEIVARKGPQALYEGELARKLTEDVQAVGGYLDEGDLANFKTIESIAKSEPYRSHQLHFVPELNGGVTVAMAMRSVQQHASLGNGTSPDGEDFLAYCKAMEQAWQYRFAHLGDGAERTLPSCTSHLSVTDNDGMVVSLTQTILSLFGSGVVSPQTGILLNNGINWFDPRPDRINSIAPAHKTLANYSPVIMTCPDNSVIALGGSGGRKILPAVFMTLMYMTDFGYTLEEALGAPRFDMSAPPTVVMDGRLDEGIINIIAAHYPVVLADRIDHPNHFTTLNGIHWAGGMGHGVAEPHHPWADAVSADIPA